MAQVVLSPVKPAMLMPLKPLNAMMLPSPAPVPPIIPLLVRATAIPQFPLPSGIVPVMSVPILLPWMTTPVGLPPMLMPSARAVITLAAAGVLPPTVVLSDWLIWMPLARALKATLPVASVPIRFPWTVVLAAALNCTPPIAMPLPVALMTLPAPAALPPIVAPVPNSTSIPTVSDPIAAIPAALVPI